MSKLVSCSLLLQIPDLASPNLVCMYPESVELIYDVYTLCSCCIPSNSKLKKPTIFAYNIDSVFCYALYFLILDCAYEIVLISEMPFAYIFQTFLKEIFEQFEKNSEITNPSIRFQYVNSYLSSWPEYVQSKMELSFPSNIIPYEIDFTHYSFVHFDPGASFTLDECYMIYKALIAGDPVVLLADSARQASRACFAAFSLLSPIQYAEPYVLWLRDNDPRFASILNGESKLKLVATSCTNVWKGNKHFRLVVDIRHPPQNEQTNIKQIFNDLSEDLIGILLQEMDTLLEVDPWSDYINAPLNIERLAAFPRKPSPRPLSASDLSNFSKSPTFKQWRKRIVSRSSWRESFLSANHKSLYNDRSIEDLTVIVNQINELYSQFKTDRHIKAVLKVHRFTVSAVLKSLTEKSLQYK